MEYAPFFLLGGPYLGPFFKGLLSLSKGFFKGNVQCKYSDLSLSFLRDPFWVNFPIKALQKGSEKGHLT